MAPIVHGLEQEYGQHINFVYLDADDPATQEFKRELGFAGLPTYILLDAEGNVSKFWPGAVRRDIFVSAFESELAAYLR